MQVTLKIASRKHERNGLDKDNEHRPYAVNNVVLVTQVILPLFHIYLSYSLHCERATIYS